MGLDAVEGKCHQLRTQCLKCHYDIGNCQPSVLLSRVPFQNMSFPGQGGEGVNRYSQQRCGHILFCGSGGSGDKQDPRIGRRQLASGLHRVRWVWLEVAARKCLMREGTGLYSLEKWSVLTGTEEGGGRRGGKEGGEGERGREGKG